MEAFKVKAIQTMFSSKEGERVLEFITEECGLTSPSFSTDPIRSAYNEGRRSVAIQLLHLMKQRLGDHDSLEHRDDAPWARDY